MGFLYQTLEWHLGLIFTLHDLTSFSDCADGRDEIGCDAVVNSTTDTSFQCRVEDYKCQNSQMCIPKIWLCDGRRYEKNLMKQLVTLTIMLSFLVNVLKVMMSWTVVRVMIKDLNLQTIIAVRVRS